MIYFITTRTDHANLEGDDEIQVVPDLNPLYLLLESAHLVGYDKETSSLNPFTAIDLLDSFSDGLNEVVIDRTCIEYPQDIIDSMQHKVVMGHNLHYDLSVNMAGVKYGLKKTFTFRNVYDTMLVEQRLTQGSKVRNRLDVVHQRRLGIPMPVGKDIRDDFIGATKNFVFKRDHILYSAYDPRCLFKIREVQLPLIEKFKMEKLMNIEFRALPPLAEAYITGFKLNEEAWEGIIKENKALMLTYARKMDDYLDKHGLTQPERNTAEVKQLGMFGNDTIAKNLNKGNINYASTDQVLKVFNKLTGDMPFDTKFEDGIEIEKPGIGKDALLEFRIKHLGEPIVQFIDYLYKYKEAEKAVSSFGDRFLTDLLLMKGKTPKFGYKNKLTGKVHTIYRQAVTENGRLASGDAMRGFFNSQNIPKIPKYRKCFVADEDYYITTCDLGGAELIILGALANDKKLIELQAQDIHSYLATKCLTQVIKYILNKSEGDLEFIEEEIREIVRVNKIYNSMTDDDGNVLDDEASKRLTEKRIQECIAIEGVEINKKTYKDLRDAFKNVVYGSSYGATAVKVSKTLFIREEYAKIVIATMESELPDTFGFLERNSKMAYRNAYLVFNKTTNSRHWFGKLMDARRYGAKVSRKLENEVKRAAKNYAISGTQADMIKEAIGDIDKHIIDNNVDATLLLQVHDELVYMHKDKDFGEVIKEKMTSAANQYLNGVIEMGADYETLRTWIK